MVHISPLLRKFQRKWTNKFQKSKIVSSSRKLVITEPIATGALFLLPAILIFSIFVIWPVIQSARISFYSWDGLGSPTQLIGISNYEELISDSLFWQSLRNNGFVLIWSLITQIPLGISLAILLTGRVKGSSFFRTLYLSPLVLSGVVVGLLWQWIYNPTFGLANEILKLAGLENFTSIWLGSDKIALVCVMLVGTWRDLGFYIVIFTTAIQGLPRDVNEAAMIDGAKGWQLHRYITIPLLKNTILTATVLSIIGSLQFFDLVWVMTKGGPYHSSELVTSYMFKTAFILKRWGYATTLGFVLFIITFVFVIVFIFLTQTDKSRKGKQSI